MMSRLLRLFTRCPEQAAEPAETEETIRNRFMQEQIARLRLFEEASRLANDFGLDLSVVSSDSSNGRLTYARIQIGKRP